MEEDFFVVDPRVGRVARADLQIASTGAASLFAFDDQEVADSDRFHRMLDDFQHVAREHLICSTQTHVGFADRDESVEVMNRIRSWLPTLLALSASSPFFGGRDTGYDSYRTRIGQRGPPPGFRRTSIPGSDQSVITGLVDGRAIADRKMIYWWARPSQHVPTLEIRIADVVTTVGETVMIAGLTRALARTIALEVRDGRPATPASPEWLDVAVWHASRFGLSETLLDPARGRRGDRCRPTIDRLRQREPPGVRRRCHRARNTRTDDDGGELGRASAARAPTSRTTADVSTHLCEQLLAGIGQQP